MLPWYLMVVAILGGLLLFVPATALLVMDNSRQRGSRGPVGASGANGAQGANGANGANGAQGPAGAAGAQGPAGAAGAQGPAGAAGAQGANGANGVQGANGANGVQGANGANGVQGANGANGAQGADGAVGAQGANGANGVQGPAGGSNAPNLMYMADITAPQNMYTLNLSQPGVTQATLLGPIGVGLTDLAFDIYGNLWGVSNSNLYSLNPYTAAATLRGALGGTLSGGARGLSGSPSGILYAMGFNDTNLWSVNTTTGAASIVFDTTFLCQGSLRWFDGFLYVTQQFPGTPMRLIRIDVTGPTATLLVGSLPNANTYGLAVSNGIFYGVCTGGGATIYFQITVTPTTVSASSIVTITGTGNNITGATFATE